MHGRVFHAIAALATWQRESRKQLDLLIQVGDLGAYPDQSRMDEATLRYLELDPAEADFSRLLRAEGRRAESLRRIRAQFASAIHFIRGNHEDFAWIRQLTVDPILGTARADPFDLFRYVSDGTVLGFGDLKVAFLGGIETDESDDARIDAHAYQSLMDRGPGAIDVLVTHEAPHGTAVGYFGQTQGSLRVTRLVEHTQPAFHIAGHYHQLIGPRTYGCTMYVGLSSLVASTRWNQSARGLQAGCLAVLDTATGNLWPVTDTWLSDFATPFNFDSWVEAFSSQ